MYNKIFTKILDSSIWLEPTSTRIVWITMIAAMDENGFCQFAAVGNVASRARVTEEEARKALNALEGPDIESSDQDNEGRRLERVPGGWMVLNATKYRELVTRINIQAKTKERVRKFRDKKRSCNAQVTQEVQSVTPSYSDSYSYSDLNTPLPPKGDHPSEFASAWNQRCGTLPRVERLSSGRLRKLQTRINRGLTLVRFCEAINGCTSKPFLSGDNDRGWTATFDWLIANDENVEKAIMNPYGGNNGKAKPGVVKQRLDASRLALANALAKRGIDGPWNTTGEDSEAVSGARKRGDFGGVSDGLRAVGPEILPPKG